MGLRTEAGGAILECACGVRREVTIDGYRRAMRRTSGQWRCLSCAVKLGMDLRLDRPPDVKLQPEKFRRWARRVWWAWSPQDRALVRMALDRKVLADLLEIDDEEAA
jgi:hypothetical protein